MLLKIKIYFLTLVVIFINAKMISQDRIEIALGLYNGKLSDSDTRDENTIGPAVFINYRKMIGESFRSELAARGGISYSEKGSIEKSIYGTYKYNLKYMGIWTGIIAQRLIKNGGPYILGNIFLNNILKATETVTVMQTTYSENITRALSKLEYGLNAGVGWRVGSLMLEAKYELGLNEVYYGNNNKGIFLNAGLTLPINE